MSEQIFQRLPAAPFGGDIMATSHASIFGRTRASRIRKFTSISRHDRLEHRVPSVGAVTIAGTKRTSFQVTELVEHEEWMIAGAFVMAVPDAHIVRAQWVIGGGRAK